MVVLHWKQKDYFGRDYLLHATDRLFGSLNFKNWYDHGATYTSEKAKFSFVAKGWFDEDVDILYNGEKVALASTSIFGKTTIRLKNGAYYVLKSNSFCQNVALENEDGKVKLKFEQPVFSFGKGTIHLSEDMDDALTTEMLVGSSLYLKAISESKVAIMVVIFMPILINMIN